MSKAKQREKIELDAQVKRKEIHRGKILSFAIDTVFYKDGKVNSFDLAFHPGAVVMIPIDSKGRLICIKQWRRGVNQILVELPAGVLEGDEDPLISAQRELREEIGMRAETLLPLGGFFTSPGFCSEYLHLFLASGLKHDPLKADDTDHIDSMTLTLEETKQWIQKGDIIDAKTIIGIYRYQDWLHSSEHAL